MSSRSCVLSPASSSQAVPSRPLVCVCAGRGVVGAGTGCWAWAWGDSVALEKQQRAGREHARPQPSRNALGVEEWVEVTSSCCRGSSPRTMEGAPRALSRGWWASLAPALRRIPASCPEHPPCRPLGPERPGRVLGLLGSSGRTVVTWLSRPSSGGALRSTFGGGAFRLGELEGCAQGALAGEGPEEGQRWGPSSGGPPSWRHTCCASP